VLAETIYSVLGDAAPVAELAALAAAHDAVLIADEARALGVAGPGGRGLLATHALAGRPEVVATATLSKSFGAQGGLVLGLPAVREHLINRAQPSIYDTGLAPAAAGAALAALRVLQATPELAAGPAATPLLAEAGGVDAPPGAVLAVPMPRPARGAGRGDSHHRARPADGLLPPAVHPDGISRLRLTAHAHHTDEELALAAQVLRRIVINGCGIP
jgi:8-amino-7-oxononanoate synthase